LEQWYTDHLDLVGSPDQDDRSTRRQDPLSDTDSEKSVRVRLCGIGILPMMHGLEAHATVGSSARIKSNPYDKVLTIRISCRTSTG
jgi:hypothetical protein